LWATSPETNDIFAEKGRFALVSGVASLPQMVRQVLSVQRGEVAFQRGYGTRLAEHFHAFRGSPWLGQILKLEVIRQACIPYKSEMTGRSDTPLQCVERVLSIEPLAETPTNIWLPVRAVFDVRGVGRWQHKLQICIPDAAALEKIRARQETFTAIQAGVATRDVLKEMADANIPARVKAARR